MSWPIGLVQSWQWQSNEVGFRFVNIDIRYVSITMFISFCRMNFHIWLLPRRGREVSPLTFGCRLLTGLTGYSIAVNKKWSLSADCTLYNVIDLEEDYPIETNYRGLNLLMIQSLHILLILYFWHCRINNIFVCSRYIFVIITDSIWKIKTFSWTKLIDWCEM